MIQKPNLKGGDLMKKLIVGIICFVLGVAMTLIFTQATGAISYGEKLKGKILLQVEENGEAWYVDTNNSERYYMGSPWDAFQLMRNNGLGVSNDDLDKIPVAPDSKEAPGETHTWRYMNTYSGSSDQITDVFNITGEKMKVMWQYEQGTPFSVKVYNSNGELLDTPVDVSCTENSLKVINETGEMYLAIEAVNQYEVKIYEYK